MISPGAGAVGEVNVAVKTTGWPKVTGLIELVSARLVASFVIE